MKEGVAGAFVVAGDDALTPWIRLCGAARRVVIVALACSCVDLTYPPVVVGPGPDAQTPGGRERRGR